jgi:hypothetical protein
MQLSNCSDGKFNSFESHKLLDKQLCKQAASHVDVASRGGHTCDDGTSCATTCLRLPITHTSIGHGSPVRGLSR